MKLIKTSMLFLLFAGMSVANAMPNPASENCVNKGGKLNLVNGVGYCTLPSGERCEEWALLRGECPAHTPRVIPGGYGAISTNDAGVQAAARFAARAVSNGRKNLRKVSRAETQIVAGTNYRLVITLSDGKQYKVTVYRDLSNRYKLTQSQKV